MRERICISDCRFFFSNASLTSGDTDAGVALVLLLLLLLLPLMLQIRDCHGHRLYPISENGCCL